MLKLIMAVSSIFVVLASDARIQTGRFFADVSKKELYRQKLASADIKDRVAAAAYFGEFPPAELDAGLIKEIINLLLKEEARLNILRAKHGLFDTAFYDESYEGGEEGVLYIPNLCEIAGTSGDLSLMPLFFKYGTQPFNLTGYGEEAVLYVLDHLEKSQDRRAYGFHCLGYWISDKKTLMPPGLPSPRKEGYTVKDGLLRARIKTALIEGAQNEKDYWNRFTALLALSRIKDEDVIPVLERVAVIDPWHFAEGADRPTAENPAPDLKVLRYPLRELAKKELANRTKKEPS